MQKIIEIALIIGLTVWLFRQVRNPSGLLGRRVVRAFNVGHAKMTDWALQYVGVRPDAVVLDVGCGGGRTPSRLVALVPEGKVFGLDSSAASISVARNKRAEY